MVSSFFVSETNESFKFSIHELFHQKAFVVEGIAKRWLGSLAFLDLELNKAWDVNIHEDIDLFLLVQDKREIVIERKENDLLMVDAHYDLLLLGSGVLHLDDKVIVLRQLK